MSVITQAQAASSAPQTTFYGILNSVATAPAGLLTFPTAFSPMSGPASPIVGNIKNFKSTEPHGKGHGSGRANINIALPGPPAKSTPALLRSWLGFATAFLFFLLLVGIISSWCNEAYDKRQHDLDSADEVALACGEKFLANACPLMVLYAESEALCQEWAECMVHVPDAEDWGTAFITTVAIAVRHALDSLSPGHVILLVPSIGLLIVAISKGVSLARPPPPPAPNYTLNA